MLELKLNNVSEEGPRKIVQHLMSFNAASCKWRTYLLHNGNTTSPDDPGDKTNKGSGTIVLTWFPWDFLSFAA